MEQYLCVEKIIKIDKQAHRELNKFPNEVYIRFISLFSILEESGRLELPNAKKLQGQIGLFEIRVKYKGQWRAIYAYLSNNLIIILSAFQKKAQKTPLDQIVKAKKRLKQYL